MDPLAQMGVLREHPHGHWVPLSLGAESKKQQQKYFKIKGINTK